MKTISLNEKYQVNTERERFLVWPLRVGGWNLYDKDTKTMLYNPARLDGLYESKEAAFVAAAKVQP